MCGICGLLDNGRLDRNTKEQLISRMNSVQRHRGPDDEGAFIDENVALGHVRLSIIDLSPAGHQPMLFQDRYVLIYNGEIYNYIEIREELRKKGYAFTTGSDTEVLLSAYDCWGEECQKKFNGFWAFALWDRKEKSLFLSRDRYGVKPLYYTEYEDVFIFASEIKTILSYEKIPRKANEQCIADYLINGFVDCEEETFFKQIYRLMPGTSFKVFADGRKVKNSYYAIQYEEKITKKGNSENEVRFRELFEDSVRKRLRADVAVGSCLSGGLDSSAIVCAVSNQFKKAGENVENIRTFSACYNNCPDDETNYIESVVGKAGVSNYKTYPTAESLWKDLDSLIYTQDEPFVSTSMYASYCVMRNAHDKKAKVLLDGQGADELLCGYRKARIYYIKILAEKKMFGRALRETILYLPYMRKSTTTFLADLGMLAQFLGKKKKGDVRRKYLAENFANVSLRNSYRKDDRFLLNDFEKIVLPALLRYVDRNSMAFSIEDRLPFLDYRLVDFCMKLPLNEKIDHGYSKVIMRKTLDMPDQVRRRKDKIGFVTPETTWDIALKEQFRDIFAADDFRAGKFIDNRKILEDWDRLFSGHDDISIFRYICLEKWMRIFDVSA